MRNGLKRILGCLLAAGTVFSAAGAEELQTEVTDVVISGEEAAVTEKDGYHFSEKGFLVGENPSETYLTEDEENGYWAYSDANLSIRITRYTDELKNNKKRVYCVADVWASEASPLFAIMSPAGGERPAGYGNSEGMKKPEKLVAENPAMLAVSDDYYGWRQFTVDRDKGKAKGASWPTGVIIRNGEILYDKPRDSTKKKEWPPTDTLAVYQDGSMKTFVSDELRAEEYIAQGATQVFAFGPWLIRNGEANPTAMGKKATYSHMRSDVNPRTVIGMIEPYHYILMVVGIPKDNGKYLGADGEWLINKLLELGCTEALNLDGGATSYMLFNGKTIIHGRPASRTLSSMIAFGKIEEQK